MALPKRLAPPHLRGVAFDPVFADIGLRALHNGTRTVHIVDHDEASRETLRGLISARFSPVIRCFRSGDAFLDQADELDAGVLLHGYRSPADSDTDVLSAIRGDAGKFATIILSETRDVALAVETMKAGAFDFVLKPFEPARLLLIVEAAFVRLERGSAASARAARAKAGIARLSPREADVLAGLTRGGSNKAIASELDLSPRTIEIHRANMMAKLGVDSVAAALRIAYDAGLFADEPPERSAAWPMPLARASSRSALAR